MPGSHRARLGIPLTLALAALATACSSREAGASSASAASSARTAAVAGSASASVAAAAPQRVPRIPLAPTAPDSLPDAVLGTAPPPRGIAVHYFAQDSATTGYLAVPAGSGPFPAVLLIHEWNGLVDRDRQVADAFAAEGYIAFAVDLYSGRTGANPKQDMALMRATLAHPDTMVANLNAAARYVRALPYASGKLATIGWCFGGGVALTYALEGAPHDGTAIFYGHPVDDPARLAHIGHPVYGTFAGLDRGIPPDTVKRFIAALHKAGIAEDIRDYPGVNHAFWLWVDRKPDVRRGPALDAWRRLKVYLKQTLQ